MPVVINIQFNCDGPECRAMKQAVGLTPENAQNGLHQILELGWERRGRKAYCPHCAGNHDLASNERGLLGG